MATNYRYMFKLGSHVRIRIDGGLDKGRIARVVGNCSDYRHREIKFLDFGKETIRSHIFLLEKWDHPFICGNCTPLLMFTPACPNDLTMCGACCKCKSHRSYI